MIETFNDFKEALVSADTDQVPILLTTYERRFSKHPGWPGLVEAAKQWLQPTALPEADDKTRVLWMCLRQSLIIALGGIEDYLGVKRSIQPNRKR